MPWRAVYWSFCAVVLAFLLVPVAAIVPLSFSSGSFLTYPMPGFSLRWYHEVLGGERWMRALANSLVVGAAATALSVLLGTLAALGLARWRGATAAALKLVMRSPMIVPMILIAVAGYFFLAPLALTSTCTGLILAHTVIAVPFVIVPVLTALELQDPNLARAAAACGATPAVTSFRVTLPGIVPAMASGALCLGCPLRVRRLVRRRGDRAAGGGPRPAHAAARDVQRPARQHHAGADCGGHDHDRVLDCAVPADAGVAAARTPRGAAAHRRRLNAARQPPVRGRPRTGPNSASRSRRRVPAST
jgi:putative spermidine/putrescine transport system permease protein